jgi:hypothetical protein
VVVGDHELETELLGGRDLCRGGDAAVDRQHQTAAVGGQPGQRLATNAIAVVEATRQVPFDLGP